jgi:hypothetical protein
MAFDEEWLTYLKTATPPTVSAMVLTMVSWREMLPFYKYSLGKSAKKEYTCMYFGQKAFQKWPKMKKSQGLLSTNCILHISVKKGTICYPVANIQI